MKSKLARKKRYKLLRKCSYCHYCFAPLKFPVATLDHKTPKSQGGSNSNNNLVIACKPCNTEKGAMPYVEFMKLKGLT